MKARGFVCGVSYRQNSPGRRCRIAEIRVADRTYFVVPPPGRSLACGDMVVADISEIPGNRPTTLVS